MDSKAFKILVDKYEEGRCSAEERQLVESWYIQYFDAQPDGSFPLAYARIREEALIEINNRLAAKRASQKRIRRLSSVAAAAILMMALAAGFWIYRSQTQNNLLEIAASDIAPGGNRATLTLADGRSVNLDETHHGIVVNDEDITYDDGLSLGLATVDNLILTTPKGGTYQVTLPDGSKVWLNAQTKLSYPSRFSGKERLVELDGEAFFDIEKDASRPFKVRSKGQEVEVLGTEFNISAYPDDPETMTTLVDGMVKVILGTRTGPTTQMLAPGEQSIIKGATIQVRQVDTEKFTAWKDSYFRFEGDLESIMAQVSRWYDVTIQYDDPGLKNQKIYGLVRRDRPLSEVLTIIETASDARFGITINGKERRVDVMR